jgi:hypothetical protein
MYYLSFNVLVISLYSAELYKRDKSITAHKYISDFFSIGEGDKLENIPILLGLWIWIQIQTFIILACI